MMRATELHIAICGHSKHGKSTVAGRVLYELGGVAPKRLEEARATAESKNRHEDSPGKSGKRAFNEFSMLFLERQSDTYGAGGSKIDPSRTNFPERATAKLPGERLISLVDTPGVANTGAGGRPDNMIYGLYLSDYAVLVVEARAGVEDGTVDVARVLAALDIPLLAILVTKMDAVGYSESLYKQAVEQIEDEIVPLLSIDHLAKKPPVIPVSALTGAGITSSEDMPWYNGLHALEIFEASVRPPENSSALPTRITVQGGKEAYQVNGIGTVIVGALESGSVEVGSVLRLEPASTVGKAPVQSRVRSVRRARPANEATTPDEKRMEAREVVAVGVPELDYHELVHNWLRHGGALGTVENPPFVAVEIEAELLFFEPEHVYRGKEYRIQTAASKGNARILTFGVERLLVPEPDQPRMWVPRGVFNRASLKFDRPLCIEYESEYRRLTRFVLRQHERVVACGRCISGKRDVDGQSSGYVESLASV